MPRLLLRCVLVGSLELFSRAVARLSATPVSRVEALLGQGREAAFRALCVRAGLPRPACEVLWHSVCAWRLALADGHGDNATELVWRISKPRSKPIARTTITIRSISCFARSAPRPPANRPEAISTRRSNRRQRLKPARTLALHRRSPYGDGVIEVAPEIVAAFACISPRRSSTSSNRLRPTCNRQSPPFSPKSIGRHSIRRSRIGEVAEFAAMLEAEIARADVGELPDFAPEFAPGDIANDDAAAVPEIRPPMLPLRLDYTWNCSLRMRSSQECCGSNRMMPLEA